MEDIDEPLDSYEPAVPEEPTEQNDALAVDDSTVAKKRRVYAKLDDNRLLSDKGIRYVATRMPNKIKFKGKGHEKGDLDRLLSAYQLWAHALFPKANFSDFIYLARRAGNSKMAKVHRRQIINQDRDGVPIDSLGSHERPASNEDEIDGFEKSNEPGSSISRENTTAPEPKNSGADEGGLFVDDDDYDIWHVPSPEPEPQNDTSKDKDTSNNTDQQQPDDDDGIPDDDELQELQEQALADMGF